MGVSTRFVMELGKRCQKDTCEVVCVTGSGATVDTVTVRLGDAIAGLYILLLVSPTTDMRPMQTLSSTMVRGFTDRLTKRLTTVFRMVLTMAVSTLSYCLRSVCGTVVISFAVPSCFNNPHAVHRMMKKKVICI